MTKIADMLTPEVMKGLATVVKADLSDTEAKAKTTTPYVVIKASTDPNPTRPAGTYTVATGSGDIEVDLASEANIEALCAGANCGQMLSFPPRLPLTVKEKYGLPKVAAMCLECTEVVVLRAIQSQRTVEAAQRNQPAIRTPQVARHQPRTTDGQDHPIHVTYAGPYTIHTEENDMDLNNLPDAKLGKTVRSTMTAAKEEVVKVERKKAKKAQAKAERKALEARAARQAERKGAILPAFMVGTTLEVPVLDLTDVENMDDCPSSTMRSPYNKARFRLAGESALPSPSACEEDASLVPTTYRVLEAEHRRLMSLAADHNEAKAQEAAAKAAKKAAPKAPKAKVEVVVAVLDEDTEAVVKRKTKALAKSTGLSKKQAREIVLAGL